MLTIDFYDRNYHFPAGEAARLAALCDEAADKVVLVSLDGTTRRTRRRRPGLVLCDRREVLPVGRLAGFRDACVRAQSEAVEWWEGIRVTKVWVESV